MKRGTALLAAICVAAALAACGGGGASSTPAESAEGSVEFKGEAGSNGSDQKQSLPERSASFRSPGGDNSIQEYGSEADAADRAKATKTITVFYAARTDGEWAKICAILSADNVAQFERLGDSQPKLKGKGCAAVLAAITPKIDSRPAETIKGVVVSLRRKGNLGFALFHGIDGKNYAMPLVLEEGEWRLTALGATPLGS